MQEKAERVSKYPIKCMAVIGIQFNNKYVDISFMVNMLLDSRNQITDIWSQLIVMQHSLLCFLFHPVLQRKPQGNKVCCISITVTSWWARWRLKSPALWSFTQLFGQAQIKEIIKALRHWPLCGEFTGDQWIPRTKGQ